MGRRWFRFRSRRDIDGELNEEIRFHLERTISSLLDAGWSLPDAEREAYRRFGDVTRYRRRMRHMDEGRWSMEERREWLGDLWRDLRLAGRALRREPALAVGIILTLALGIGANTTMFGIVDRLLLSGPLHVQEVERLRRVLIRNEFSGRTFYGSSQEYATYVEMQRVDGFETVGAYAIREMTLGFGERARHVDAGVASATLFPTLGVDAARGRFFSEMEDRPGGPPVAVLGHEFWRTRYAEDPAVLGSTIQLGERDYTVIGIAPPGFTGADLSPVDVWVPLHVAGPQIYPNLDLSGERNPDWQIFWLQVIARLQPDASATAAEAQASAIFAAAVPQREDLRRELLTSPIISARGPNPSDESQVSLWLSGVSLIVLLVACANVANMLLARGVRRRAEIGVRLALGAPRWRLARQLLTESLLLGLLGGVAALALAEIGGGLVRRSLLPDVAWGGVALDGTQVAFTAAVALLTGLLAGMLPALQWGREDVMATLKSRGGGGARRSRVRPALLIVQAALSVLLLTGAGLFVRSLQQVSAMDMGLDDPDTIVVLDPERSEESRVDDAFDWPTATILDRLQAHPAVTAASAAITTPFGNHWAVGLELPDRDNEELDALITSGPYINPVADGYFATLGLRILRGRPLDARDREGSERVAVVNEAMADLLWPGESALGQCLLIGRKRDEPPPPCTTVVGVVETAKRDSIDEEAQVQYYVPIEQQRLDSSLSFLVRLRPDAARGDALRDIQSAVLAAAPGAMRYVSVYPLQERIAEQTRAWRLGASMFTAFGILAMVVAAIGLYGVLAFDVAQRTRELGVRAALGATAANLRLLVLRRGARLTGIGIGLGTLLALAAGSRIESLLFRVSPRDPVVLGAVAATLLAISLIASWLPAVRATRVDPNRALRQD